MGITRAIDQTCCLLPSLLPIAFILGKFWHQFGSKVLPIALTVAHYQCWQHCVAHCQHLLYSSETNELTHPHA
jgi:hypothetical protein